MSASLVGATSPSIVAKPVVLVPVGSIEQHGPHLPLDTDTVIADAVARRAADLLVRSDVLVAPPVTYGSSGEHQHFPGTSSIGTRVLTSVLIELVRSMRTWAQRVVFVNAHGGNIGALRTALAQMVAEGHDTGWAPCAGEKVDAHAGYTETSLMLHLRPESVRSELAAVGNTTPVMDLLPRLVQGGVAAVSPNGVLGNPSGATAAEGRRLLDLAARSIVDRVAFGTVDQQGCLRVSARQECGRP